MIGLSIYRPIVLPALRYQYCIPDLQFDDFVVDFDGFGSKLNSDGGIRIDFEFFIDELHEYTGLANAFVMIDVLWSPMMINLNR